MSCGCGCEDGPQCETVSDVFRCVLTAGHVGRECESYNARDETVMLGVFPQDPGGRTVL